MTDDRKGQNFKVRNLAVYILQLIKSASLYQEN